MYVYLITNNINNKKYVGITNNYKKRFGNHKCSTKQIIGKAIQKYGAENFSFDVIEENLTVEEAKENRQAVFNRYKEYLMESPTNSIKFFDWENPVKVSLIDEDADRTIVSNAKSKAALLSKNKEFKENFISAARELMEGDNSFMTELLSENSSILALEGVEFKEFVGLTLVSDKELFGNKATILEDIKNIISEDEYLSDMKTLYEEEGEESDAEGSDASLETSDKDIDDLKSALDKALEKITDEKLVAKINALKDALDTSKDSGTTDVGTVKECVELLSF